MAVEVAGRPLRIRSGRVAALLATLLLEANRTVPTERLIEAVWDWNPPPTARSQLAIVVSQLRRLLDQAGAPTPVVSTETAGYRLNASIGEIDALLFEEWVAEAERAEASGRTVEAVGRLRAALDLWRGPALAGLDRQLVRAAATLLAERRAVVQARRIELEFALGRHDSLITELLGLTATDPFNERHTRNLILALYRSGRVTEALNAYVEFRRRLIGEVGIEPGPQLAELHRQILNRDPVLDPPAKVATLTAPGPLGGTEPVPTTPGPLGGTEPVPTTPGAFGDTEPDRPDPRPGRLPGHRRAGGRPRRRPGPRPGGRPVGPTPRRPGGRDGTTSPQGSGCCGVPDDPAARPASGAGPHPTHQTPMSAHHALTRPQDGQAMPQSALTASPDGLVTPNQLPPVVADFVGREPELARIRRVVRSGVARPGPAVVVVAGLPGVGKSTLAIRTGWQLGAEHPDGCLYAELVDGQRGPVDPHEVLGAFLHALGVPDGAVPAGRTERRALYRSIVARRRLLVVLDGADDEEQVRPLLPTGPGSTALITARRALNGLDGAHLITLDVLPVEPAVQLLTGMLPERVDPDVSTARRVVQLCDGLPLAIRATGSRLAVRAEHSLSQSAERLADGTRRLDRLVAGDHDVRRGLASTYQRLDQHAATLLRRLGALPVGDFPGWLAAPLLDVDQATAERALGELVDAGLLHPAPGRSAGMLRHRMSELVRLYARERVGVDDPPPLRATAFRRAYWWLLELTLRADEQVPGQLFPTDGLGPPPGGPPADLLHAVDDDPVGWLDAERRLVVAAGAHCAALGETELAWRLAVAPTNFFQSRGDTDSWRQALEHGRTVLRGRPGPGRAQAMLSLSHALLLLAGAEAIAARTAALTGQRLFRELGDPRRVAACATVQWMAARRMGPPDPVAVEQNAARRTTADLDAATSARGAATWARAAPQATPAPRSGGPEPVVPGTSARRTPEVVPVLAGQVGPPDPARARVG